MDTSKVKAYVAQEHERLSMLDSLLARLNAHRSGALSTTTANTWAPSSASRTVMARPLPQPGPTHPAPVTMATLDSKRRMLGPVLLVCRQCVPE